MVKLDINMSLPKHFTVSAYIVSQQTKKVLLVHHKILNLWLGPGGHIDPTEAVEEALRREITEETGIKTIRLFNKKTTGQIGRSRPEPMPNFIEIHPIPGDRRTIKLHEHINLVYYGVTNHVRLAYNRDEHHGIGWFSLDEAKNLTIDASSLYHVKQAIKLCKNMIVTPR